MLTKIPSSSSHDLGQGLKGLLQKAPVSPCDAQNTSFQFPYWVPESQAKGAGGSGINVVPSKARTFQYFCQAEVSLHVFVKDDQWRSKRIHKGGWPVMDMAWAEPKNQRGLGIVERSSESRGGGFLFSSFSKAPQSQRPQELPLIQIPPLAPLTHLLLKDLEEKALCMWSE